MTRALATIFTTLAALTLAAAAEPATVSFSARLADDTSGEPLTGQHRIVVELFAAASGGLALYSEARDVDLEDGLVFADIGSVTTLDSALFDGRKLFLQITVDDSVMEPRLAIGSVPYALRAAAAANADTIGGLSAEQLQQRVTGTCGTGNFIIGVNPDGTVACAPDLSGTGDITDVVAGSGLQGGGGVGSVTLSLVDCGMNEILKFNGAAWACAVDANAGGDITAVNAAAGGGLVGGGAAGDVTLGLLTTCGVGQLLKWNGTAWTCANDVDTDTNAGGDVTAVLTAANSGLVGGASAGDVSISLLTSCAPGQLLKWNGSGWACANDIDTDTNAGGDITDVTAGAGLIGGGATGAVSLDVGQGTGIVVAASTVSLDTTFTDNRYDPRYVNASGDTMTGNLDMAQTRVLNRGCPAGYVRHGPGLCAEDVDAGGFTFSSCANRCRAAGTHLCSSAEMRSIMQSGVTIGNGGVIGDWVDDQDSATTALVINSNTDTNLFVAQAANATFTTFCRCCASVE